MITFLLALRRCVALLFFFLILLEQHSIGKCCQKPYDLHPKKSYIHIWPGNMIAHFVNVVCSFRYYLYKNEAFNFWIKVHSLNFSLCSLIPKCIYKCYQCTFENDLSNSMYYYCSYYYAPYSVYFFSSAAWFL